jgi:ankyrin repeat protein
LAKKPACLNVSPRIEVIAAIPTTILRGSHPQNFSPMIPEDASEPTQDGADSYNKSSNRPWECLAFEMELRTAINLKDVAYCDELLREKGHWLAELQSYEFAKIMDTAIHADDAAEELLGVLLQAGVPAHCVYDKIGPHYQHTPLVTAARLGRLDLIEKLVAAGADVFWASPTGANALSAILPSLATQASIRDTPERAQIRDWLMGQGLRIDPTCEDSMRKICWASSNPVSWPDVPGLVELGIPIDQTGWTPFMFEIVSGTAVSSMIANLTQEDLHHRDGCQRTPFLLAVTAGDLEVTRALLERGSDLHAKGHCGATALHLAAKYDHCHLVEWLLERGLPLDVRDEFGDSALHAAVDGNCLAAARLFLEKGADVRERDDNGYALIHDVSFRGDLAMLKLLLLAGADVNDVSGGGSWPLHDACGAGNAGAVSYLLTVGANPNLTSSGGTALFAAVSSDSLDCVRLLAEAGADLNATDCDEWTSLFHLRSVEVAQYLLDHGANPGISDQCDGLPEDWGSVPKSVRQLLRNCRTRQQQSNS